MEWISVEDRLPSLEKTGNIYRDFVLVLTKSKSIAIAIYDTRKTPCFISVTTDAVIDDVTYWMPSPELPFRKKEDEK